MDKKKEIDDLIVYAPEEEESQKGEAPKEIETDAADTLQEAENEATDADDEKSKENDLDDEYYDEYDYEEKSKKSHIWIWVTLIVIAVVSMLVMIFHDTPFMRNYRENFKNNLANIMPALFVDEVTDEELAKDTTVVMEDESGNAVIYKEYKEATVTTDEESDIKYVFDTKKTYMIPYEGTAEASIANYDDGIVCGRVNSISYIDSEGQIQWEMQTSVASPIVKSEGKYIVVAEDGGNRVSLYEDSEMLFDIECPHQIKSCNVSSNGDVVLVVEKDGYKGGVTVYNRRGKEVFVWSSGQHEVLCADISSASRRVAVGLLNADSNVYSVIQIFDITKTEGGPAVRFNDTVIFDVDYSADVVTGYGDNSMVCMTSTGRVIIDRRYDEVEIAHKAYDEKGNKAILFVNNNIPVVQTYNRKGTLKAEVVVEELADCIDVKDDYFLYNSGRDVIMRNGDKNRVNVYTATMDIADLHIIDKKTFVIVHSNSLEIVELS